MAIKQPITKPNHLVIVNEDNLDDSVSTISNDPVGLFCPPYSVSNPSSPDITQPFHSVPDFPLDSFYYYSTP